MHRDCVDRHIRCFGTVVLEDLKIGNMSGSARHHRSTGPQRAPEGGILEPCSAWKSSACTPEWHGSVLRLQLKFVPHRDEDEVAKKIAESGGSDSSCSGCYRLGRNPGIYLGSNMQVGSKPECERLRRHRAANLNTLDNIIFGQHSVIE
jgi:hypothetical protein